MTSTNNEPTDELATAVGRYDSGNSRSGERLSNFFNESSSRFANGFALHTALPEVNVCVVDLLVALFRTIPETVRFYKP